MPRKSRKSPKTGFPTATEAKAVQMVKRLEDRYRLGKQADQTQLSLTEFAAGNGLSTHTVRRLRRLAREYTPSEYAELCALRRPGGLPLHVGHLPYLLVVSDKREREKLQRRAAREGWSAPEWSKNSTERVFPLFFAETRSPQLTGFCDSPLDFGRNHPDAGPDILN